MQEETAIRAENVKFTYCGTVIIISFLTYQVIMAPWKVDHSGYPYWIVEYMICEVILFFLLYLQSADMEITAGLNVPNHWTGPILLWSPYPLCLTITKLSLFYVLWCFCVRSVLSYLRNWQKWKYFVIIYKALLLLRFLFVAIFFNFVLKQHLPLNWFKLHIKNFYFYPFPY